MTVRTRFAPSPTGFLHIGGLRTALFCWLYARHHGGQFVLRIEDTDLARSTQEAINQILDGMQWAGLAHDEGPFYQTQRFDRYREVIAQMLAAGTAYHCYCTKEELDAMRAEQSARGEKPRYDGRWRERHDVRPGVPPVVRFKNPQSGEVIVDDVVHGRVQFRNQELDDLIIARSDGTPTYNFCVVVDDMDMKITHVIRGDDHLNNTPRQQNMLEALGCTAPVYAHLPMILGADGTKLSKRHGAVSVLDYRDQGFLPEAVLNYLARLGWSHGDQEVFSITELVALFDIAAVNKSAAAFDTDKLLWLNQQHLKSSPALQVAPVLAWHLRELGIECQDMPLLAQIVVAQRERVKTVAEMAKMSVFFFREPVEFDDKAVRKHVTLAALNALQSLVAQFANFTSWTAVALHEVLETAATTQGLNLGKIAQPIRLALCGGTVSPPIDITLAILGQQAALARLERALQIWRARSDTLS